MIRNRLMLGTLAVLIALAASQATTQEPAAGRAAPPQLSAWAGGDDKTIWDSVYTAAQAQRGERLVTQLCSACHAQPSEVWGAAFLGGWNDRTVADLFDQLHNTMPKDSPGSLTRQEYVDVITYMLRINEVPAGATELGTTDEALKAVRIRFPRS